MENDARNAGWVLVAIDANGHTGEPLARVRPLRWFGETVAERQAGEAPLFAAASLAAASEEALVRVVTAGASGVLLEDGDGWEAVERLVVRLAVAEARAGVPDRSISVMVVATTPRTILARLGPPPPIGRLIGIGIDIGGFTPADPRWTATAPAVASGRGLTLLIASSAGVPAFERHAGPVTTPALSQSRADGFGWALVPEGDAQA